MTRPRLPHVLAALCVATHATSIAGQTPVAVVTDSVTVIAGEQYRAGSLHRLLFGTGYRRAWTTSIRVERLDLGAFAGGLTPTERGGGGQTKVLRFRGGDGRDYAFRSIDKELILVLPEELRSTLVDAIVQDQISAQHPFAPLAVSPLLDAVGILYARPRLVILPDDPRLGEFRGDFGGMLGLLEERPNERGTRETSFAGATSVVSSERMLERLEKNGETVDARAFLAARLTDIYLGDRDRHADQWRWARFGADPKEPWQPIARDRDQAFVRQDGLLTRLARQYYPQLVSFESRYPDMVGLTWSGRDLDRRLLSGLEAPVWDSVTTQLLQALTDSVIEGAVAALPKEIVRADGDELSRRLRARRDALPAAARRFYRQLAAEVDIHVTDSAEVADVHLASGGSVDVVVTARDASPAGTELFRRRFLPRETSEIRLYLHGGADSVRVHGAENPAIALRIVGGGGNDILVDESGVAHLYDTDRGDVFVQAPGSHVDTREFEAPPLGRSPLDRDWGSHVRGQLWFGAEPDIGVLLGMGIERYVFGFRHLPWSSRVRVRGAWAPAVGSYRAEAAVRAYAENSSRFVDVEALASGVEIIRFHGFGNETRRTRPDDDYRIEESLYRARARLSVGGDRLRAQLGPTVQFARTDRIPAFLEGGPLPYGMGSFGQIGMGGEVVFERRDRERSPTGGAMARIEGSVFPQLWDVERTFGKARGVTAVYLSPWEALRPTLALRAGAEKAFGDYPFREAAFLGDAESVRLRHRQRYAGDAAAHANAELRLKLGRPVILLPADVGVFGLWDVGRVWYRSERSDRWHDAWGGGAWMAFLRPENVVALAVVRSNEGVSLWLGGGFAY